MARVDALIRWFMPKEERFHELFDRDTANLLRAARSFAEFAQLADLEARRAKMSELRDIEHEGDNLTRQIFRRLHLQLHPPFRREDNPPPRHRPRRRPGLPRRGGPAPGQLRAG